MYYSVFDVFIYVENIHQNPKKKFVHKKNPLKLKYCTSLQSCPVIFLGGIYF